MDHVVYVDTKANELKKILDGHKTMIIRGAAGRKLPHGRVNVGDILYLIENNAVGMIKAKAMVKSVFNSEKMNKEESEALVAINQLKLILTDAQLKRWAGKRYLVLVELSDVLEIQPFGIDKSNYGNMDDWLPVGDINSIKVESVE